MQWLKKLFGGEPCGTGGDEPKKEPFTIMSLYDKIVKDAYQYPTHVGRLELEYKLPHGEHVYKRDVVLKFDPKECEIKYCRIDCNDFSVFTFRLDDLRKHIINTGSEHVYELDRYNLEFKLSWVNYAEMEKLTALGVRALLEETPLGTALRAFNHLYMVSNDAPDESALYLTHIGGHRSVPHWVTDSYYHFGKVSETSTLPSLIVTDDRICDVKYLPMDHHRRWVTFTETTGQGVVTIVPTESFTGKVISCDVVFDLDDPAMAGVSVNVCKLLYDACGDLWRDRFKELYGGAAKNNSALALILEPKDLKVKWGGIHYNLWDFIYDQIEKFDPEKRPYILTNVSPVNILENIFGIDRHGNMTFKPAEAQQ
ncbi:hypothetical protein ST201phi2-1p334 [Pseudomonas phage 201phi2-1]|uniref:Uncharacterized protein n=1 Tax=Pseudomonas phage 201phi2-1 TaxID=198110 RepID=B3FJJ4_BP201|nr:hypothetical protein ST201phi2-1p334 [Pseudomonas phage 201phi2-1]ABY63159.1 hypothetical protein 201phi2-1p334 [Pseudomonas phage 201phi2-1]